MDISLHHMFALGVPVAEKILRPLVVYLFLIVGLRLAGKRELAQLNPFDLVVLLTLSNTVQNAIIGDDLSITGGVIGAATLLTANHLVVRVLFSNHTLECLVEGVPVVLIEAGQVQTDRLRHELVTLPELETAAHKQGFASLEDVERAVLDTGGGFAFEAKQNTRESQRHDDVVARLDQIFAELQALRLRS